MNLLAIAKDQQQVFAVAMNQKSISNVQKQKNYSTRYSRAVPHRSTDRAITSLTLLIGREAVLSGVYGRS